MAGVLDGIAFGVDAALSPDGASLVFRSPLTGPGQLYMKRRDEVVAHPLPDTERAKDPPSLPTGHGSGSWPLVPAKPLRNGAVAMHCRRER